MSKTSGQEMETTKGPEEKTYGYQEPQESESMMTPRSLPKSNS